MRDADKHGLYHMPADDACVASLVVSPDEALRADARCPNSQCRITDDLVVRTYNTAARVARTDNTLSLLMLALNTSIQGANLDPSVTELLEASLPTVGHMTRTWAD